MSTPKQKNSKTDVHIKLNMTFDEAMKKAFVSNFVKRMIFINLCYN